MLLLMPRLVAAPFLLQINSQKIEHLCWQFVARVDIKFLLIEEFINFVGTIKFGYTQEFLEMQKVKRKQFDL